MIWERRGDGYYLYYETLNETPATRRGFIDQIGPLPVLFPEDKRLDAEVVADFPEQTPVDRVLAAYSRQSKVTLEASPFVARCKQSGEKMTLDLREEMAYLARTFRATWERRREGYILTEDRDDPPPAKPEQKGGVALFGGLAILATAALATLAARPWRNRKRMALAARVG